MKVVIAPDKFKGSLPARDVAAAIARGIARADPRILVEQIPMADGGEGTVDALVAATGGRLITRRVTGPRPEMKVEATFGLLGDGTTAVIEMAAASGLHLLRADQQDPMATTTYGTGELLLAAREVGARRIILGIGGSATTDGGLGCAHACGAPVLMRCGGEATTPITGRDMVERVDRVAPGRSLDGIEIVVASDVINPLFGPDGAARIFGPQKGATSEQVEALDRGLRDLAERQGALEVANRPGAGAAGGLGFGMMAYLGATLRPGFEIVADAVRLRERLAGADLVITGEGRLDESSLGGKTAIGVARLCRDLRLPCVALVGSVGEGAERTIAQGLTAYFSICDGPMTLEDAMRCAAMMLERTAAHVIRLCGCDPSLRRT
ncbi:MAG TPA: glycerate kinase [Tepidisphaeraceae bacterium]|jgi:glycerate kinase